MCISVIRLKTFGDQVNVPGGWGRGGGGGGGVTLNDRTTNEELNRHV